MQCKFCSKEFETNNSLLNHEHRCKENPNAIANKFTGATKSSGKNFHGLVKHSMSRIPPLDQVLVENSTYARHNLKRRIIKERLLEYKCVCCGNEGEHNNKPLVLQLDHINGVNNDHRLKNLRFLCPNCHTQQDTYAAKNIIKQKNITV
jgi:Zn finger protein HypA/HybF involved in hydrogenase expression